MLDVVDLINKAFAKIKRARKKIMDYAFIFGIFNKILKKMKRFEEYMECMFEHNKRNPIGPIKNQENVTH